VKTYSSILKIYIMKKFFSIITIMIIAALVFTSCKNNTATQAVTTQDTIGLSAFRDWKVQQYQEAMNAQAVVPVKTVATKKAATRSTRTAKTNYSNGSMNSSSTHTAQTTTPATKRGWSKAAKGAVIGGAGGAVLGAVINKRNRVAGGIIGGVLGGGIGYGIGRSQDKKDGRINLN
jgi:hypothetical protein